MISGESPQNRYKDGNVSIKVRGEDGGEIEIREIKKGIRTGSRFEVF
jgi:hypothetical protein